MGDGASAVGLADRARAAGLDHRLRWHGTVPGASRLLRAYDVLVLSSRTEGTPMILLEAMAAGVPIVATAVGGVPDVLSAAEAFLVTEVAPGAIAEAVGECLDRPEAAASRAGRARIRVEASHALGTWLDRHELMYRSLA
jgi:glycosyltransferase involved in cell wall biosynthesis